MLVIIFGRQFASGLAHRHKHLMIILKQTELSSMNQLEQTFVDLGDFDLDTYDLMNFDTIQSTSAGMSEGTDNVDRNLMYSDLVAILERQQSFSINPGRTR